MPEAMANQMGLSIRALFGAPVTWAEQGIWQAFVDGLRGQPRPTRSFVEDEPAEGSKKKARRADVS